MTANARSTLAPTQGTHVCWVSPATDRDKDGGRRSPQRQGAPSPAGKGGPGSLTELRSRRTGESWELAAHQVHTHRHMWAHPGTCSHRHLHACEYQGRAWPGSMHRGGLTGHRGGGHISQVPSPASPLSGMVTTVRGQDPGDRREEVCGKGNGAASGLPRSVTPQ